MGQYATRVARLLVWCVLAALTCGASAACSGGGLLRLRGGGAVELTEIKDFLQITRHADARLVVIKKPKKGLKKSLKGMDPKFLRNQRYCKKHQATGRSEA